MKEKLEYGSEIKGFPPEVVRKEIVIDSDLLPEWANWVSKDRDEKWFCYDKKPELTHNQWIWRSGQFSDILSGFIPKFDGKWEDSLFKVVRKNMYDTNE